MVSRSLIKDVIDAWNTWFQNSAKSFLPRKQELTLPDWHAMAIIGVRRSGKSFFGVKLLRNYPSVFVMNFEDPFFIENNTVAILDKLISVFTEFSQQSPRNPCELFSLLQ